MFLLKPNQVYYKLQYNRSFKKIERGQVLFIKVMSVTQVKQAHRFNYKYLSLNLVLCITKRFTYPVFPNEAKQNTIYTLFYRQKNYLTPDFEAMLINTSLILTFRHVLYQSRERFVKRDQVKLYKLVCINKRLIQMRRLFQG